MDLTLYKNFNLIDVRNGEIINKAYMVVDGERITEVARGEKNNFPGNIIDLENKYVMPGLINSHVHITYEPVASPHTLGASETYAKAAIRGVRNLKIHLNSGTTFLRSLGTTGCIDLDLRDARNKNLIGGAEFITSSRVITMTGGHGWANGRQADGLDEVRKAAREQLKAGADVIKIMATGGVMTKGVEPGSPQLTMEEMKVAVEEAHKAGKKTATHAQGTQGIKNAVLAGIDSVEHGIFLDEEVIQLMVDRDTYLVPTLTAPYFIVKNGVEAGIDKDTFRKAKEVMDAHSISFYKAYRAGVKIAMGTDSGTPFNLHSSAPFEISLMVEAGMDEMDALRAATLNSADLLDISEDYGAIENNKFADFLVLKENPILNIGTLEDILQVYKKGKLVNRRK